MFPSTVGITHSQRPIRAMQMRQPVSMPTPLKEQAIRSRPAALHTQAASLRGLPLGTWPCSPMQHRLRLVAISAASKSGSSDPPVKPAYNKYRSKADINRSYLRQWQEVTARGAQGQTRMTLFSALGYLPRWAKYTLVPDFARFLWWLVWVRVCAVAHVIHRAAVLQGAKVDAQLERRRSGQSAFSRAMVLRRYHHRVGLWENLVYRWRLLRGSTVGSNSEAAAEPQTA